MVDTVIYPSNLRGELNLKSESPSKSILHREIICAALSDEAELPYFDSDDVSATYSCMRHILSDSEPCYVGESASTLRFLIPLSVYLGGRTFYTAGRLALRPLSEYSCMTDAKITVSGNKTVTSGQLNSGDFFMRGDVSSQFVTGLMFALPLLNGDSSIHLTCALQSSAYAQMTQHILARHGISVLSTSDGFFIKGNQKYLPCKTSSIEADWSYAAFFIVANALGAHITLSGLETPSLQADSAIMQLLLRRNIDISQTPDLFPALCVLGCGYHGETVIYNAARLRLKECDRLHAMATELNKLGADIQENSDSLVIHGCGKLDGGEVDSHGDHRIAMSLAIAASCLCTKPVTLHGSECVRKSAPRFFEHMQKLEARIIKP